jgi:hypothetical protein
MFSLSLPERGAPGIDKATLAQVEDYGHPAT